MAKYIIIESKYPIDSLKPMLMDMMSEIIKIQSLIEDDRRIIIIYDHEIEVSLSEVVINLVADTFADIRMYESYVFQDETLLHEHKDYIKELLEYISFPKYMYLNDLIVAQALLTKLNPKDFHYFLRNYTNNQDMKNTIKVYLESNQNMSLASKKLYIHRNTLIQRIDKFVNETGFDIKTFVSGYVIYYFLTH